MTDYRDIYDDVHAGNPLYALAEGSPGVRLCWEHADRIRLIPGRSLDVGCGAGFVVQLLAGYPFERDAHGVDVSDVAIKRAQERVGPRARLMTHPTIPHDDDRFALVTCFDVLEHLDEDDAIALRDEMLRVLAPGGALLCSVSCRAAGSQDKHGDNLHRTVRGPEWWAEILRPDEYTVRRAERDMILWRYPSP
ncbi:MAG: class I SAM-dependent methyltransferase [Phycisphaerales bacterium]